MHYPAKGETVASVMQTLIEDYPLHASIHKANRIIALSVAPGTHFDCED